MGGAACCQIADDMPCNVQPDTPLKGAYQKGDSGAPFSAAGYAGDSGGNPQALQTKMCLACPPDDLECAAGSIASRHKAAQN